MEIDLWLGSMIRWLLTTSAGQPADRLIAIDALDRALADHFAACDCDHYLRDQLANHQEP